MTEEDKKFIGFRLALHIEDSEKQLRKMKKNNPSFDSSFAKAQLARLIRITYTEFIPDSWSGPRPTNDKEWLQEN